MSTILPRFRLVGMLLTILAVVIFLQMIRIQVTPEGQNIKKVVLSQAYAQMEFPIARGSIYDRHGNLLAGNRTVYEIGLDMPNLPKDPAAIDQLVWAIKVIFPKLPDEKVNVPYLQQAYPNLVYLSIENYASQEQARQLFELAKGISKKTLGINYDPKEDPDDPFSKIPNGDEYRMQYQRPLGLVFKRNYDREYPEHTLAANVLGFVSHDARVGGSQGVEEQYDRLLSGNPKIISVPLDPHEANKSPIMPESVSLILTIDREVQTMLEEIVDRTQKETKSASVTVVVENPRNGEILGMASTPRMDLNDFSKYKEVYKNALDFNRAVTMIYEPGSVFKVLTMAAALDSKAVTPDTSFNDTGEIQVGEGAPVRNWDYGAWGAQTMEGCMEHSLNVCLAWVATQLGKDRFYDYMQKFNIGRATGVDLAFENPGRLKVEGDTDWTMTDLGRNAYGQGVSVTPIQMVMAVSAVANDGKMMLPHVVKSIIENGRQHDVQPQLVGSPISAETAHTITNMLAQAVQGESYQNAVVTGYRIAGKTGTAGIPDQETGDYDPTYTNASFVGWGPVDDPQFVVYVWLEKPVTEVWGSLVASPVFAEVVERLVVILDLPEDTLRAQMKSGAVVAGSAPQEIQQ